MEARVRAALPGNAGDARIYSLLGEILRRRDRTEAAYAMFDHALTLAHTEIHALQWSIHRAVEAKDHTAAMDALDVMFRRWPDRMAAFATGIPPMFSQPESYAALLNRIEQTPPWRSRLIYALSDFDSGDLAFTARLLQDLASGSSSPKTAEIAPLLANLFRSKQYDLTYRTFLFTLGADERDLSGFVFNGQFRQGASNRRFDWVVHRQPGVTVTMPAERRDSGSRQGLLVEFGGAPVLRVGLEQTLMLPPGTYRLEFTASAIAAELPKSLLWAVDCLDPSQPVQRVEVPEGNYQSHVFNAQFTVPRGCPVQSLTLRTNAMVESWSSRYSGKVLFDEIHISAVQS